MSHSDHAGAGGLARTHPALTDPRTGLPNSLHFDLVYNYLFEAGSRGLPLTVMLVSAGADETSSDSVLREIGQAIHEITRTTDLVSHRGSGRFVVVLLGTNLPGGRVAADRVEVALSGVAPGPACFGLAAFADGLTDAQALIRMAETALLVAEAAGGGVEFA
jgi:GGDEF domain-containing protein